MVTPVLAVHSLVKRFGGLVATDGVTLRVEPGELHALIGPNGAGKTTLVQQLAGGLAPTSGRIEFMGADVTRLPMHDRVRAGIARSHQITSVFKRYTVLHNLLLAVQAHRGMSFRFSGSPFEDDSLTNDARAVCAQVGLQGLEDQEAQALSHGEQRKLEIALALATRPKLLLLDEPLAGMGSSDSAEMVDLIESLKGRLTMILVEHDVGAVFRLADKMSVLVYGKVIATGVPSVVRQEPEVRKAYLGNS